MLGPLLFLIYVNDLPSSTNKLKLVLFANDSNILINFRDKTEVTKTLNEELEKINDWFKANGLKLNASKTICIMFSKNDDFDETKDLSIRLDGTELKFTNATTFLGLIIDEHMSWDEQAKKVANKISKTHSMINRLKNKLPVTSLKTLYDSLLLPQLLYGIVVWGGSGSSQIKRIKQIQKKLIRTISKSWYRSHTKPRMKELQILNFDDLYYQQCSLLVHDIVYGEDPKNLRKIFKFHRQETGYNLRQSTVDEKKLEVKQYKTKQAKHIFFMKAPICYNKIPEDVKLVAVEPEDRKFLKKEIKRECLKKYQEGITCSNPFCKDKSHYSAIQSSSLG